MGSEGPKLEERDVDAIAMASCVVGWKKVMVTRKQGGGSAFVRGWTRVLVERVYVVVILV